jgi:16S rRNA (guanine(966)-N(2))-methyltransferase RsmD
MRYHSPMARIKKKQIKVSAGTLKGRVLNYPGESALRPTMKRTKESIFDSLGQALEDAVFVDLYAAAGGIGIEALSRGARFVHFVENDRHALECLRGNIDACGIRSDRCRVHARDVLGFLREEPTICTGASIVWADPPYDSGEVASLLEFFGGIDYSFDALLVMEHRRDAVPAEGVPGLVASKIKRFGQSWVSFFVPARGERS